MPDDAQRPPAHTLAAEAPPLDLIEAGTCNAARVAGALRAVSNIARAWHTVDHPLVEQLGRNDLADLIGVLADDLHAQVGRIDQGVSRIYKSNARGVWHG